MMQTTFIKKSGLLLPLLVVAGCAVNPPGPSVAVMPAPGKPFEQFAAEDQYCRNYASQATGMTTADANTQSMVGSAVVGTVVGAAAGAAMGGRHNGAASGAEMGLLAGTMIGAGQGASSARDVQRRYDIAYEQCMYSKGNQLPSAGYRPQVRYAAPQYVAPAPQPVYTAPSPPLLMPPPPPPALPPR
jgi:hypothetical protein